LVPAVSQAERDLVSRKELFVKLLRVALPPLALVGAVLGSIIAGIAAPTEAASMGALGAIVVTAIGGRMSWSVLRETTYATTRITAMMMFIPMCAQAFSLAFRGLQGEKLVQTFRIPAGRHQCRHLVPDVHHLHPRLLHRVDRDFLHRGAAVPSDLHRRQGRHGLARHLDLREPADLVPDAAVRLGAVLPARCGAARGHHGRIYRGIVPFVLMQLVALVLCFVFPQLALWLPRTSAGDGAIKKGGPSFKTWGRPLYFRLSAVA